jgi:hypothetical protein
MSMFLNRSIALFFAVVLSQVAATPDLTPGTVNCTDPSKNRVIGFKLLDGSNDPLSQIVVTDFSTPITIDLNKFANCDLNVQAIVDTNVPANCDINNVRCVRMTFGNTIRRDFNRPFTVYLASGGSGLPIDLQPLPGKQILQACPYTEPSCLGTRPRCFQVEVDVIGCNKPPTNAPVKPPTNAPVKPPTNAPVKSPTYAPVKPPTKAPVKPPIPVCPYPQEWVDGYCKDTCRNDYVCPANSCRIAHRLCYDNFDDCQCNYGYYKSSYEDKCIKYWWCPGKK